MLENVVVEGMASGSTTPDAAAGPLVCTAIQYVRVLPAERQRSRAHRDRGEQPGSGEGHRTSGSICSDANLRHAYPLGTGGEREVDRTEMPRRDVHASAGLTGYGEVRCIGTANRQCG